MSSGESIDFVVQTQKYVEKLGQREYRSTQNPGDIPVFRRYIDAGSYAEMVSSLPIDCVDILIYSESNDAFLIGTRQQEPHKGDWVIGGRRLAGESDADAAARNMKRELKLAIDPSKLRTIGQYNVIWDSREQPPIAIFEADSPDDLDSPVGYAAGSHNLSILKLYPLSEAELTQVQHNQEYSSLHWVQPDEVLHAPAGTFHPCLVDMFTDGLEAVTTPEPAASTADQRLRFQGAIATAQTALRKLS